MASAAPPVVEVAVDSLPAALLAVEAGAGRLELCAGLGEGGSTPSLGLLEAVRAAVAVPVFVLVRPRAGSFVLEPGEQDLVRRELELAVGAGADGLVVGALTPEGSLDLQALQAWRDAAPEASFTVHRAFDEVADRVEALEALGRLGFTRVLTTGGADRVEDGLEQLAHEARLCEATPVLPRALPGGGVRAANAAAVLRASGGCELHTSARTAASPRLDAGPRFGALLLPDPLEVARLVEAVAAAAAARS